MTDYFYDMDLVVDPLNPSNVVANGLVSIYDPADTAGVTLLALKDPSGLPLPNPLPSNANGFLPPRIAQVPQTMWKSGGFTGYFNSYKGLRDESVAAVTAAQSAANDASTAAAQVVTTAAVNGSGKLILTKANGAAVDAGSVIGPKGDKGDTGSSGPQGPQGPAGVADDASIAAQINSSTSATKAALSATYVPRWKADTAYLAGDKVLSPNGDVVSAKVNFTSGAAYSATNWNLSASFLPGDATGATDGQVATWDAATGKFKPKPGGGTGDVAKSATGYAGSPAFVQDPTLAPAVIDSRTIAQPVRKPAKLTQDADLIAGEKRNLMQYTEDSTNARWSSTMTKNTSDTIVRDGITLTKFTSSSFFHLFRTNYAGVGMAPFAVGKRYLASMFVLSTDSKERWFWMRELANSSDNGHGKRLLQPNVLTRVWHLYQADTTSTLRAIGKPADGFTANTREQYWAIQGGGTDGAAGLSFYAGGLQLEQVDDTALAGIAGIGDSTMAGASGGIDSQSSFEWMSYTEALLNCQTFNRGIGGNKLTDMDTRWATDITPLKPSCKYVIIQGGINDIGNGASLATIQGAVNSMTTKAKTDGFIPVYLTCTPTAGMAANAGYETIRLQFNDWLKATFANTIDIASVVADPYDPKYIRRTPGGSAGWYGDGTHYTRPAKRAIAELVAAWPGWDLPTPTPYQKVAATTYTPGGFVVTSPDGTKYRITVANGGALTAVAI